MLWATTDFCKLSSNTTVRVQRKYPAEVTDILSNHELRLSTGPVLNLWPRNLWCIYICSLFTDIISNGYGAWGIKFKLLGCARKAIVNSEFCHFPVLLTIWLGHRHLCDIIIALILELEVFLIQVISHHILVYMTHFLHPCLSQYLSKPHRPTRPGNPF